MELSFPVTVLTNEEKFHMKQIFQEQNIQILKHFTVGGEKLMRLWLFLTFLSVMQKMNCNVKGGDVLLLHCYHSPPLMNKNPTFSKRSEEVQALPIVFFVL